MNHLIRKAVSIALAGAVTFSCASPALAAFSDFKDVSGHWAKSTLEKAYADKILNGYNNSTMAPNKSVTTAQAVTILCRVLGVTGQGDTSGFSIPAGAWYAGDIAKGVYAGLIDATFSDSLDQPITRGDAFCLFVRAFQIADGDPDLSVLDRFPDAAYLSGETEQAAATLISAGVVGGSEGKLQAERSLTRAEFATILYRLVDQYSPASSFQGTTGKGAVLSGNASLSDKTVSNVWFGQTASTIALNNVSADVLGVRSDTLESLDIQGTGSIQELILAARTGDVTLTLPETYTLDTLTVGQGTGNVEFAGTTQTVSVTGDTRTVTVNSPIKTLIVAGDNNTVSISRDCPVEQVIVRGKGNTIKLDSKTDALLLAGRDNTVSGSGRIGEVALNTKYYKLSNSRDKVTPWTNGDLSGVSVSMVAPESLAAGDVLKAEASVTVPEADNGKLCTAAWYLNGQLMEQKKVRLSKDAIVSSITPNYTHDMLQEATVSLVLTYTNSDGDTFTKTAEAPIYLFTFSDLGLADASVEVSVPDTLPAGQALTATAVINTPETGKACTGTWYVDGKKVSTVTYVLGSGPVTLSHRYDYYHGMPETSTVAFRLDYTTQDGRKQNVSGKDTLHVENFPDNGIARASATLSGPTTLEAGKALYVTAKLNYLEAGKQCTGTWYVDGTKVATVPYVLGKDIPTLTHSYKYTENMKLTSEIKFVLSYTTQDGRPQSINASTKVNLKNYGYGYYHKLNDADVLRTVTSGYAGNYTLAWAQNHDYTQQMKTAWVNLKGYSSKTQYLVWVNLTYQRVNIFTGSQGNWKLVRSALCGSGKPSTPTIRGVFTTSYKQSAWNYGSYYCGPIVRFNGSSGYAFHSRLEYWPMNSNRYYDARIGFPISHGCLRMYNDDIWYMYNNIPNGTTVVVY